MNAEIIGYTLLRNQWEVLRRILKVDDPFHVLETSMKPEAYKEAYDNLCDLGLLTPCSDRVIVEALSGYLLTELSDAALALGINAGDRQTTLLRTQHMLIIVDNLRDQSTLTPVENAMTAKPLLAAILARCPLPMTMVLYGRDYVQQTELAETRDIVLTIFERLYSAFSSEND